MRIIPSPLKTKKYQAIFNDGKKINFGQKGASDYTIHHDKERRQRYLDRHKVHEDWDNPKTAGALSKWLLWGESISLATNVANFNRRFGI